jgi:hypothetical protein
MTSFIEVTDPAQAHDRLAVAHIPCGSEFIRDSMVNPVKIRQM